MELRNIKYKPIGSHMEYKFDVEDIAQINNLLNNSVNEFAEVMDKIQGLESSVKQNQQGEFANNLQTIYSEFADDINEISEVLCDVIETNDEYVNDIKNYYRPEYSHVEMNLSELIEVTQSSMETLESFEKQWHLKTGDDAIKLCNDRLEQIQSEIANKVNLAKIDLLSELRQEEAITQENLHLYRKCIEIINDISFEDEIIKIEQAMTYLQSLEDTDTEFSNELKNLIVDENYNNYGIGVANE